MYITFQMNERKEKDYLKPSIVFFLFFSYIIIISYES